MRLTAVKAAAVMAAVLLAAGCSSQASDAGSGTGETKGKSLKIGMSYDIGGRGDPFNDIAAKGLDDAKAKLGAQFKELEASAGESDAQREARLRLLAQGGYDPVIAVGFAYAGPLKKVAADFPKVHFAIVDDASVTGPNVTNLVFAENEGSYLVGALAASASKVHHIGFIGGVNVPLIQKFQAGFEAGAKAVDANIKIDVNYLTQPPDFGGFNDPQKAKVSAKGMYDGGADVVYHAAGASGAGVFSAAAEAKLTAVGCNTDQYESASADQKPYILSSMLKRVDVAVYEFVNSVQSGQPLSGVQTFDLKRGGVGVATSNPSEKQFQAKIDELTQKITSGAISVPDKL